MPDPTADSAWPQTGRLLGIDYGTVRVGLAICDPSQKWVSPLNTYQRRNEALDREYFLKVVREESVMGLVIGLPIHCDGQESQKSNEVRHFAVWLREVTGLPSQFADERFSTAQATRLLAPAELTKAQRKSKVDRVAAMIILESFLERNRTDLPRDLNHPLADDAE
jgi:putative Holliday junction resolvase